MSIRLRLTLLYSAILALTLIAFSTILYVTQTQATYSSIKANLVRQVTGFAQPAARARPAPGQSGSRTGPGRAAAGQTGRRGYDQRHAPGPVDPDAQHHRHGHRADAGPQRHHLAPQRARV